jgi:hypothetical protein
MYPRGAGMINTEVIYCVECNLLLMRRDVQVIFKTGFYRTTIPLGHCKDCADCNSEMELGPSYLNHIKYGLMEDSLAISYQL